jgi:hypothetical protein
MELGKTYIHTWFRPCAKEMAWLIKIQLQKGSPKWQLYTSDAILRMTSMTILGHAVFVQPLALSEKSS